MRKVYADLSYTTEHSIGLRRSPSQAEAQRLLRELPEPCDDQERDVAYLLWAIAHPDDLDQRQS
jgi:hypothetical protein